MLLPVERSVNENVVPHTGFDYLGNQFGFTVSPNPASDVVQIAVDISASAEVTIAAFDVTGRHVGKVFSGTLPSGSNLLTWNTSSMGAGVYFIRIVSGDVGLTQRIAVMK